MNSMQNVIARVLLGHIFLIAGINKISGYAGTQGYMEMMGVSGELLPLVILLEIVGGIALIVGLKTRWSAYGLAAFTVVAGLIFHSDFAEQMQSILFMKNIAITGGLLLLGGVGAGRLSLDSYFAERRSDIQSAHA